MIECNKVEDLPKRGKIIFSEEEAESQFPHLTIISQHKSKPPLNKSQKTFNCLIRQIEQLQKRIGLQQKHLDELFLFYGQTLRPLELEICKCRTKLIKRLFQLNQSVKTLTKKHSSGLKYIMRNLLSAILDVTDRPEDEEMEAIYKMGNGKTYSEIWEKEVEEMKDMLNHFARMNDMKLNLDWLQDDIDEDAIIDIMLDEAKRLRSLKEEQEAQRIEQRRRKYKTKRQLEEEECQKKHEKEAEELKNRSLSEIYKQLAKVLHPDLETDPERKKEKEALMKKLTVAYKEKNLHALLLLELEWIHKEEGELEKLTEAKLNSYNEILKMQVIALENDFFSMRAHPRYEPLFAYNTNSFKVFAMPNLTLLKKEFNNQRRRKKLIEEIIEKMNKENPEEEFKTYLQECYVYFYE